MPRKFDPRKIDVLVAPEREAALHPKQLLESFGLKTGDTLADIGCGPGFFTIPAAEIVGAQGKVYAVDVQSEMIAAVMTRVADLGLHNVEIVKASDTDVPLPDRDLDLVLMAFMLHEMPQRSLYLHRLRHTLRPAGKILILEWEKIPTEMGPPIEDRLTPEEMTGDVSAAGYRLVQHRQITPEHYALVIAPM
jgi:ubiquinone/menaquinone biosynthesis C-methylase UbiE